jgi:hypothetical protein
LRLFFFLLRVKFAGGRVARMEQSYHISKDGQNLGPYSIEEIRSRLRGGELTPDSPAWTEGMADWQPIRVILSSSLPPIPTTVAASSVIPKSETLATVALMLPLGGTALNMFWVGGMNLLQGPGSALQAVTALVVIGTAILIGVEAGNLGMGGPNDPSIKAGKDATPPIVWGIATILFWILSFPIYMYHRSKFGVRNQLAVALLSAVFFIGSIIFIINTMDERMRDVRRTFNFGQVEETLDERTKKAHQDFAKAQADSIGEDPTKGESPSQQDLFRETLAKAKTGDAASQSSLVVMYGNGVGITKDETEARKWALKAAEQNDARAQRNLYLLLSQGLGGSTDMAEALQWLRKAAEQNVKQCIRAGGGGKARCC